MVYRRRCMHVLSRGVIYALVVSVCACGRIAYDSHATDADLATRMDASLPDLENSDTGPYIDVGSDLTSENDAGENDMGSVAAILVSPTSGLSTSESGESATYTVVLATAPSADVSIPIATSDASEGLLGSASFVLMTFTPSTWSTPQSVTVTGVDDDIADGPQAFTITLGAATTADPRYSGMDATDVNVTNLDDDSPGIGVDPTSGLVTTEGGTTATFTVVLQSRPTATVTLQVGSSDLTEGTASPTTLTFNAASWNAPQTVTVTGVNDAFADGDQLYNLVVHVASSADANYASLADIRAIATNIDDETASITVSPTSGLITTEAGGTATFTLRLSSSPTSDVTIALSSDNTLEGTVAPASVVFTTLNWNVPRTIVVTGVNDFVADGARLFNVVTALAVSADSSYSGLNANDVSVTNTDNDVVGVTITPTSGLTTTEAGAIAMFQARLTSQPTADVTISLNSTDASEGSVLPVSVTFTSLTWSTNVDITVSGVDDALLDGDVAYSIVTGAAVSTDLGYDGFDASDVSVINQDNDVPFVQQAYVKAASPDLGDLFGSDVALSGDGDTLVVGAFREDSASTGVGGSQTDDTAFDSGAAYVFVRTGATWAQQAYIKASNTDAQDFFGDLVDISDDGNTIVVSAVQEDSGATGINGFQGNSSADSGAVYVFTRSAGVWTQQAYVKPSNTGIGDHFGSNLALSADGDTLAVSSSSESSNATGINGDQSNNLASSSGAVYVFTRAGGIWAQQAYVKSSNAQANDFFGSALALSAEGNTLAVSAMGESSAATGIGGNQADNTATSSGAVYVFTRSGAMWTQDAYIKASNTQASDGFGTDVSLSADGSTLGVGAFLEDSNARGVGGDQSSNLAGGSGAVYVFTRTALIWSQEAYIKSSNSESNDGFGYHTALSFDGNTLAVTALNESSNATGVNGDQFNNLAGGSGAVYLLTRMGSTWTQFGYVKASNTGMGDQFGTTLALSADASTLVVSSFLESSNASGINGDQSNNAAVQSGAVYLFAVP